MKSTLLLLIFTLPLTLMSQSTTTPEKIYSITKRDYPTSYYTAQLALWKEILENDQENKAAWQNYYMANRMLNIKNYGKVEKVDLAAIIDEMEKAIPNSYEFNYLKFANGHDREALFPYLEKAYAIEPHRTDTYQSFITYYVLTGNEEKRKAFAKKEYEQGVICNNLLNWNYNVLMSTDKNAILITQGDNDTYPIWSLQDVKGVREDVTAINIHLLLHAPYRDMILKKEGIPAFDEKAFDGFQETYTGIIEHLFKYSKRPINLGLSISREFKNKHDAHLYLTGMVLKYDKTGFDNLVVLKDNFENKFVKDYLSNDFSFDPCETVVNSCNLHYIPSFKLLYKGYKEAGDNKKAEEVKQLIKTIAVRGGREEWLGELFKE